MTPPRGALNDVRDGDLDAQIQNSTAILGRAVDHQKLRAGAKVSARSIRSKIILSVTFPNVSSLHRSRPQLSAGKAPNDRGHRQHKGGEQADDHYRPQPGQDSRMRPV